MDFLKTVSSGGSVRFSTRRENLLSEVARNFQRNRKPVAADALNLFAPEQIVYVQNNSGNDCNEFDVLGVDSIAITPADDDSAKWKRPVVNGITPSFPTHLGNFVITYEPIASGDIGRAYIGGVCFAYVNVLAAGDNYADITSGDTSKLTSGDIGQAQILLTSGTGPQYTLVRMGPIVLDGFTVSLTQTGGSATAGWTYTAKSFSGGFTYGTSLTPEETHWGYTNAATIGIGRYDNTSTFKLTKAYEAQSPNNCS